MRIDGVAYRSIALAADGWSVDIIDQTRLPHDLVVKSLRTVDEAADAIRHMLVRGAPLIGATAAYGLALGLRRETSDAALRQFAEKLVATRPTAVNLQWVVQRMLDALLPLGEGQRLAAAYALAAEICDEDVAINSAIGDHGLAILEKHWREKQERGGAERLNILTHCNAGWLATVDWGTALAPIYKAFEAGIPVHVWVDETRPRNQGAHLTCWELGKHGVPHTLIVDNAGGHLMQQGEVDLCITGTDRTTATGDVCNKIGTYLKALAAKDNGVPFYVALPGPTIDWQIEDGLREIPIENRGGHEVEYISGAMGRGETATVRIVPEFSSAANPAFDVTPARLITALITERGVASASREGLAGLYDRS